MRSSLAAWAFAVLTVGCDGGPAPCIVDSDCRDFQFVCFERRCTSTREVAEAGVRDAGRDAGRRDAAVRDGGDSLCMLAGSWAITALPSPCGTSMVGYSSTIGVGSTACAFTAASVDGAMPALDGPFTVDGTGAISGSLAVGGGAPQTCTGRVSAGSITFTCGSCNVQLDRSGT